MNKYQVTVRATDTQGVPYLPDAAEVTAFDKAAAKATVFDFLADMGYRVQSISAEYMADAR